MAASRTTASLLRLAARRTPPSPAFRPASFAAASRCLSGAPPRLDKPGSYSRTDPGVEVEYPAEDELPKSKPVHGIPGQYVKPTLASFSLDGNVGVVTGGARGLGLVIGQGMVYSGSDLALVDMNSELLRPFSFKRMRLLTIVTEDEAERQCQLLVDAFKRENPNAER